MKEPFYFFDKFCPFIGIDYKGTELRGRSDWKPLLAKYYNGGSVYAGAKFNKYMGFEFGFTETTRETWVHVFGDTENFFDNGNTAGAQSYVRSRFAGYYLDLNFYYPCFKQYFQVVTALGIARIRPRLNLLIPALGNNGTPPTTSGFFEMDARILEQTHGVIKYLPRVGFGAQNYLKDCFGWRLMLWWDQTSRLRVDGPFVNFEQGTIESNSLRRAFKDSISITVGFFYHF